MNKQYTIAINGELADSGSAIDVLARSVGLSTYYELLDENADYIDGAAMNAARSVNWTDIFTDFLNEHPELLPEKAADMFVHQPLKAGAFVSLTFPAVFETMLADFVREQLEDVEEGSACKVVQSAYDESREYNERDLFYTFLNGDRSFRSVSVLGEAKKAFPFLSFDYVKEDDIVCAEITEHDEALRYLHDNVCGCDEVEPHMYTDADIIAQVSDDIQVIFDRKTAEKIAERAKWREEHDKLKKYQAEQKEKAENARKEKLLAMTK